MKVFVRTGDLSGGKRPEVVAFYDDDTDISPDAHGPGMSVITVPGHLIAHERDERNPMVPMVPRLADNWRSRVGPHFTAAEAERRVNDVLAPSEQVSALHEVVEMVVQHGTDVSKWPSVAKARKAELDEKWNYLGEVRERARAHAPSAPIDPSSDKVWPARLKRA